MERADSNAWEALQFRTACALDGSPVEIYAYRRNGIVVPHIPGFLARGERDDVDEQELLELRNELCYGLNEVERRTWLKVMLGWKIPQIAADEGVSHVAIYSRLRGRDGSGGMVKKNRFVWFWWQLRQHGRLQ